MSGNLRPNSDSTWRAGPAWSRAAGNEDMTLGGPLVYRGKGLISYGPVNFLAIYDRVEKQGHTPKV